MGHSRRNTDALVDRLSEYDAVVEVGIGRRTAVAETLVDRGLAVTVTDIHPRPVPDGVAFVEDDIVDPDSAVYADADAVYALNLPPELHRPTLDVARQVGADFLFTTLGGDQPAIPVERTTLPAETVYVSRSNRPHTDH